MAAEPTTSDLLAIAQAVWSVDADEAIQVGRAEIASRGWTREQIEGALVLACNQIAALAHRLDRELGGDSLSELALYSAVSDTLRGIDPGGV